MVYSLQASAHEAFGHEALLSMLNHLTSRVDAKREPVVGDEILLVLRRRLLAESPDSDAAQVAAEAFATVITRMRAAHAMDGAARRAAEDDRLALRDRIAAAYPFHPALIETMTERWASLPDFQRTRGALRFLVVCLYTLKGEGRAGGLATSPLRTLTWPTPSSPKWGRGSPSRPFSSGTLLVPTPA